METAGKTKAPLLGVMSLPPFICKASPAPANPETWPPTVWVVLPTPGAGGAGGAGGGLPLPPPPPPPHAAMIREASSHVNQLRTRAIASMLNRFSSKLASRKVNLFFRGLRHQLEQVVHRRRLGHVRVEAGLARAHLVLAPAVAGERHEVGVEPGRAQPLPELVAREPGQADVDERHVGLDLHDRVQAARAVDGGMHGVPLALEQHL